MAKRHGEWRIASKIEAQLSALFTGAHSLGGWTADRNHRTLATNAALLSAGDGEPDIRISDRLQPMLGRDDPHARDVVQAPTGRWSLVRAPRGPPERRVTQR